MGFISDTLAKIKKLREADIKAKAVKAESAKKLVQNLVEKTQTHLGITGNTVAERAKSYLTSIVSNVPKATGTLSKEELLQLGQKEITPQVAKKTLSTALSFGMGLSKVGKVPKVSKIVPEVKPKVIPEITPVETAEALRSAPPVTPVSKLTQLLNKFKPLRTTTEELYTKERGARFGQVEKTYTQGAGQAGYHKALGQLKGELPKAQVPETLQKEIQTTLGQGGIDEMFNTVQQHPYLNAGEKTSIQAGLGKVLSGDIPTQGELDGLEMVFGPEFTETLKVVQPWKFNLFNVANEIGGTLKVILSSFVDMSATLRQGVMYAYSHPIKTVKLVKTSAEAAVSPNLYKVLNKQITDNAYYPLAKKFRLGLTEVSETSPSLNKTEEQFLVKWIQKIPGVGHLVKATERAFVSMMNKMRADTFYGLSDDLIKAGYSPVENPNAFLKASKMVNSFTGRGNLGKALENATELTNLLAWSPRLIASRLQILASPITYANAPNPIKKEVARQILSYIGVVSTVTGLAGMAGADVELSPKSSDFLKIKVGNRRWDISGGLAPYIRTIVQLITGEKKVDGVIEEYQRSRTAKTFLQSKASPMVGIITELFTGKLYSGEKITPANFAQQHLVPLTIQDVLDASKEVGWINSLITTGVPSFFGVSSQAYKAKSTGGAFKIKDYTTSGSSGAFKIKDYTK